LERRRQESKPDRSWPHDWAKKILRKKLSGRDENRHLDVKKEVNFRMSALIDRYWEQYASKKKSYDREKSVLEGVRDQMGTLFVREVSGITVDRWYRGLTGEKILTREPQSGTSTSCTT
jgi:hypothetical protein